MHGIISLLDDTHYQLVKELWAELKREFGIEGVYVTPYPHFSYQIAPYYDLAVLEPILRDFASQHAPFQVSTTGLGIFTGASPVLYIQVVRSPELTRFQQEIWQALLPAGQGIVDYYHPRQWMPHITIGFGDLNRDNLAAIIGYLAERDFTWQIPVDNITLIYNTGARQDLRYSCALSGGR